MVWALLGQKPQIQCFSRRDPNVLCQEINIITKTNFPSLNHATQVIKILSVKLLIFSYPSDVTYVLGVQKNHLIETVLLSTHNIAFGWEIRKIFFVTLLTKGLIQWHSGLQIGVCNQNEIFLFLNQNIYWGYSKEPPKWDGSLEHPQQTFKVI